MPLVQGGPPEWVWERPAHMAKWSVAATQAQDGPHTVYEIRIDCGMQVLKVHFFNEEELRQLIDAIGRTIDLDQVRKTDV